MRGMWGRGTNLCGAQHVLASWGGPRNPEDKSGRHSETPVFDLSEETEVRGEGGREECELH